MPSGPAGRRVAIERCVMALVALGSRRGRAGREAISYRDLGVEELGAVYERVLDLDPHALGMVAGAVRSSLVWTRSAPSTAPGESRAEPSTRRNRSPSSS